MNADRWRQIDDRFRSALKRQPQERSVYSVRACGGDDSLCREVESLIASCGQSEGFIELPACEFASPRLVDQPSSIAAGQSIGHYTILAPPGVGGMEEVYLAEDSQLGRRVALKLLPALFTGDWDRSGGIRALS
jgi:hypothetical protein